MDQEQKYLKLFENAPESIFLVEGDTYIDCNQSALKLIGASRKEELIALHPWDLSPEKQPSGRSSVELAKERISEASQQVTLRFEWMHKTLEGKMLPVDVVMKQIRIDDRIILYAVWRDIAERKRAEAALKESEYKYRLLFENANDAIVILQDGIVKFHNPRTEELLGLTKKELHHLDYRKFVHPDDQPRITDRHTRRLKGEKVESIYDFRSLRKDGEVIWCEVSVVQIRWEGRPATLNLIREISLQKKLEQQLAHSQKLEAIGTLAGGIAHDFNNILASIIGFSEMVRWKNLSEETRNKYLDQVLQASSRARDLVKQILSFSRANAQDLRPVTTALIVKEAMKLLGASIPSTIRISTDISPSAGMTIGDPGRIHQIIMNLCTNSAYAMKKKGGILEVSLTALDIGSEDPMLSRGIIPGAYQKLSVKDTGEGIDPKIRERIFEPFFTTKDTGEGTGMGLPVVYGIVKDHSGHIVVQSEPGHGTKVDVYLPRIDSAEELEPEPSADLILGDERILVVDDEPALLELNRVSLQSLGYRVTAFASSPAALEAFRKEPDGFDMIITDMTMPEMTGADLAAQVLLLKPKIPIILCTGYTEAITPEQAYKLGIREYVMKPISIQELSKLIRKLFDGEKNG